MLGGHDIRDRKGMHVVFDELTSTPATMQAERCLLAGHCANPDEFDILQSDCLKAYIQSKIGGDRKTFVRLPKKWWPAHWHDIDDPVCELILALYGHPRAGECWYERISGVLFAHGFWCIPEWPCVFVHNEDPKNIIVFILYVDDLIMLGGKT